MTSADDARQIADDAAQLTAGEIAVRRMLAGIVASTVDGGSGAPMLAESVQCPDCGERLSICTCDEPVEGDEHWIDHDGLTEPEQEGWER